MKKILVVDDEEMVRIVLKQMLEQGGYACDVAANGIEALEKLKADNFNLLITDINMPEMDGVELLAKTKELFPTMPVIFITAYGKDKIIMQAMRTGLSDYIEKPFRMDDVFATIKQHV
jgi:DNA-binding NtrC family response regulator